MADTRVVVAAERTLFRQGLGALIRSAEGFCVVGEAADMNEARRVAVRERPGIIVLDSEIEHGVGACDLVACLRASCPDAAVVVIGEADRTTRSEAEAETALREERARVLLRGAGAYIPARADSSELLRLLTVVAATLACNDNDGGTTSSSEPFNQPPRSSGRHRITERERAIVAMIVQGLCNKEIAHRLGIGTQTVKNHVSHLLEKLALADRTQLAVHAVEHHFEF